jgi:two-component system, cell cycle response regulator DivK
MPGKTVLVVDDDETSLKIARFVLEAEGFVVYEATDALSTLERLKTVNPAIIVMDIQLPGMDGWELTRRLKANLATCHIPIVAITAYVAESDKQSASDAGFAAYLEKSSTTNDLAEIIRRHLVAPS